MDELLSMTIGHGCADVLVGRIPTRGVWLVHIKRGSPEENQRPKSACCQGTFSGPGRADLLIVTTDNKASPHTRDKRQAFIVIPDFIVDVAETFPTKREMLACHASQVATMVQLPN